MLAGVKLILCGLAGVGGVGCLAPLVIESGKDPVIWKVSSESSPPLLICQSAKPASPKIFVSLEFKNSEKKEIVLKAYKGEGKEKITEDGAFSLYFWKNGKSKLGEQGGEHSHIYGGDNIPCSKNIFVATRDVSPFKNIRWESPLKNVKLTFDSESCKTNKECWVKIEDSVGLTWKWGSGVKIIFDN